MKGGIEMKENEFEEELAKQYLKDGLVVPVYWGLDDDENVLLDTDSMEEEFENKMNDLKDILGKE